MNEQQTVQGPIGINKELYRESEPFNIYLIMGCTKCKKKRAFKIRANVENMMNSPYGGFFIQTHCSKCGAIHLIQIFKGKDLDKNWTYMALQDMEGVTVEDKNLMKE